MVDRVGSQPLPFGRGCRCDIHPKDSLCLLWRFNSSDDPGWVCYGRLCRCCVRAGNCWRCGRPFWCGVHSHWSLGRCHSHCFLRRLLGGSLLWGRLFLFGCHSWWESLGLWLFGFISSVPWGAAPLSSFASPFSSLEVQGSLVLVSLLGLGGSSLLGHDGCLKEFQSLLQRWIDSVRSE